MTDVGQFLYTFFAFLPFVLCVVWLGIYVCRFRRANPPQRFLVLFIFVCALLYFCHSWFFMMESAKAYDLVDVIYLFCNLSVYPLYYIYIRILVGDDKPGIGHALLLLPAFVMAPLAAVTSGNETVISVAKALFTVEVLVIMFLGLRDLKKFDKAVHNFYSDTDDKTLWPVYALLGCFVVTSILSTFANMAGRAFFHESVLVIVPSIAFSLLLFGIFYVGLQINFYAREFKSDIVEEVPRPHPEGHPVEDAVLEAKIAKLMNEQKLYLKPGLKISDVALAVGSNRTYVSAAINRAKGMSFSDYVNSRRIEYAKQRLLEEGDTAITSMAETAGFASFPSFYRAFVKFTGKSPTAWLKDARG